MTVQNDFIPIATAGGANVASQATFAAAPETTAGFANGEIPTSALWNKMLRQSASIAAMLAAFVVFGGTPMVDDGNVVTKAAAMQAAFRTRLIANQTFYIAATGSDSNSGLVVGSPWLTLQHAINVIQQNYDLSGFVATIQIADGTYAAHATISGPFIGSSSAASLVITGNAVTPSNVIYGDTTGNPAITVQNGAQCTISNLKLATTGSNAHGIFLTLGAFVSYSGINFGAVGGSHISCGSGAQINCAGNYTITGAAVSHFSAAQRGAIIASGMTVTITGTPAFSAEFALAFDVGLIVSAGATWTGSATGVRYSATINGVIDTNAGGANYFPGNSAGSIGTQGLYV